MPEKPADPAAFPVVEQDPETFPTVALAAHHDAGVGGPVGPRLQHQFEIAEGLLGDQIAAIAAAGKFLFADNIAVLDEPVGGVLFRLDGQGNAALDPHVGHGRPARMAAAIDARDRPPARQCLAIEQRAKALFITHHASPFCLFCKAPSASSTIK